MGHVRVIAEVEPIIDGHSRAGRSTLTVDVVAGQSAATKVFAVNPLKLLVPQPRGASVWAYTSSFGGGLVAGDETRLDLWLGPNARCFLGTQASTKIYRNPGLLPCSHTTRAEAGAGSVLVFAPDPIQAFAGSRYAQRQEFRVAPGASLVLVDWFSSGRSACGERWEFNRLRSRNEVFIGDERAFLDSVLLASEDGPIASQHRTGRFNCFATLVLFGPAVRTLAETILAGVGQQPVSRRSALLSSASPMRDGIVLRVAGQEVEAVGRDLRRHLAPLSALLGDDPWARKW